jgi:hypothetical protein
VLEHERHHRKLFDPLRIALGQVVSRTLFFLPAARLSHTRYCALAELAADDQAIDSQRGDSSALASAMLAFMGAEHPNGAVGIAPERVDHLLGRRPAWRLPVGAAAASIAVLALGAAVASQLAQIASARVSLALPVLSPRPCIVLLTTLATGLMWLAAIRARAIRARGQGTVAYVLRGPATAQEAAAAQGTPLHRTGQAGEDGTAQS